MPYVNRENGLVVASFALPQTEGQEFLPVGHSDLTTFYQSRWRRRRSFYVIYQAINSLTSAQKTVIWSDLISGSPPKWSQSDGPNSAAIAALQWSATNSGATAANLTDARLRVAAMYAQDNPSYLMNPSFAPTIAIAGDEPAV